MRSALCSAAAEDGDSVDNDCDAAIDEDSDADGFSADEDCGDAEATIYPSAEGEYEGIDNSRDGDVDKGCGDTVETGTNKPMAMAVGCSGEGAGVADGLKPVILLGLRRRRDT